MTLNSTHSSNIESPEYLERRQHLDRELSFLFKDKMSRSPEETAKFYALMKQITQRIDYYHLSQIEEYEIVTLVYQKALKKIKEETIDNPYGWCKKVAWSTIRDIARKQWGKETIEYQDTIEVKSTLSPYQMIEMRDLITRIFDTLDDLDAQILSLHLVEGYSLKEIVSQLPNSTLSYEAVRKRYYRICQRIKNNDSFKQLFQSLFV